MRVAVTGGAGFIGSHVVDRLAAAGHEVVVLDLRPPHRSDVEYHRASVLDRGALIGGLRGCGTVFHLAGVANVDEAAADPVATAELNVTGTARVWEAARQCGVGRAVLASTVWVYGAAGGDAPVADETAVFDVSRAGHIYTASKLAAELVVHSCHQLFGQEFTILRYGIPYGPRMRGELVIARFVERALSGEPIVVHGDGSQYRNYVYVEDLAEAHVLALGPEAANQVFNLEGEEPVTVRQLVASVVDLVPNPVPVEFGERRPGDYAGQPVSAEHAHAVLGWQPQVPFAEGLQRYVDWRVSRDVPVSSSNGSRLGALVRERGLTRLPLALIVLAVPLLSVHGGGATTVMARIAVDLLAAAMAVVTARWGPDPTPRFAGLVLSLASVWLLSQAAGPLVPLVAMCLGAGVGLLLTHRSPPSPAPIVAIASAAVLLLVFGVVLSPLLAWWIAAGVIADASRGLVVQAFGQLRWRAHLAVDTAAVLIAVMLSAVVGATSVRAGWFSPPLRHGSRSRGEVSLTFDASDPDSVSAVAAALDVAHVQATFFISGKDVQAHPTLVSVIRSHQQFVGNGTYDRNPLRVFDPRVGQHVMAQRVFREQGRVCPAFLRPPDGYHTPLLAWSAGHRGIAMVAGDVAVSTRRTSDPSLLAQRVLSKVRAGSIVRIDITHGGTAAAESVATSVPAIVAGLHQRNLTPVRLDVLLDRPSYTDHC